MSSPSLQHEPRQPHAGWTVFQALWPVALAVAIGLIMFYGVGPRAGGYPTIVMMFIGINIILAVSLTVVNGFAGQFSLGHAGFMALGGYTAAAIVYYGSMMVWKCMGRPRRRGRAVVVRLCHSGPAATDAIDIEWPRACCCQR